MAHSAVRTVHSAAGAVAMITGGTCGGFIIAAVQTDAQSQSDPAWLWIGAAIAGGMALVGAAVWWLTRPKRDEDGLPRQAVSNSSVGGGTLQTTGSISAGRDINLGVVRRDRTEEPSVRVTPAVNGKYGFIIVENPGVAEKFALRVHGFLAGNPAQTLRPRWSRMGEEEQNLKKGESDWCHIITVEPDPPPIFPTGHGEMAYPIWKRAEVDRWLDRRQRHQRLVRFLGEPAAQDIEVEANSQYVLKVAVLSDTRDPYTCDVTYGVTENDTLVMPFDQEQITLLNEEAQRRLAAALEQARMAPEEQSGSGKEEPQPQ